MELSHLTGIERTEDGYRVRLLAVDGTVLETIMTVDDGEIPLVHGQPDLSTAWPGDAESLRRVNAAVIAFHRASSER